MARKTQDEWIRIIEDAARSDLTAAAYCERNGISTNQFYKMSHKLGYTHGGERTEKWHAAVSMAQPPALSRQGLVPVPAETLQTSEYSLDPEHLPDVQARIFIQYESFKISVGNGFSKETLERVMEVIASAQNS